ncbi:MAG: redoxin domain-containing protein, partial [Solirubrobacteraceae bacterium]
MKARVIAWGSVTALVGALTLAAWARIPSAPAFAPGTPAPEFVGITRWLNSEPLSMAALRGKVVLVEFWTFACSNCVRMLPQVSSWHDTYAKRGLVVVGVHTPETDFEEIDDPGSKTRGGDLGWFGNKAM